MPAISVSGVLYGDEGKGKVSDAIGKKADIFVKYQGGTNSGNTVVIDNKETILHGLPAGVMRNKRSLIASGCVMNPEKLDEEIELFDNINLGIDPRTPIIFPYHIALDIVREMERKAESGGAIGTTAQGIGPCYEDAKNRTGIRFCELAGNPLTLEEKIRRNFKIKEKLIERVYNFEMKVPEGGRYGAPLIKVGEDEIVEIYLRLGEKLRHYLSDVSEEVMGALNNNKNVLFQGSQGNLLDITFGNYPKVTSSHPGPSGIFTSVGLPPMAFDEMIGVVKAYITKVGSGPVVTCLDGGKWPVDEAFSTEEAKKIRAEGKEFGATTKRSRRIAWQDLALMEYSCKLSGFTQLAITKLDVLAGIKPLKLAYAYEVDGKTTQKYIDWDSEFLSKCKPKYIECIKGGGGFELEELEGVREFNDLPIAALEYINIIEDYVGIPVTLISIGADRNETILRNFKGF
jgi:adenylosuccinate synthase